MPTDDDKGNDARWTDGLGDYWVNEDGSRDRITPVPAHVKAYAEENGLELLPDHIPADQAERYGFAKRG